MKSPRLSFGTLTTLHLPRLDPVALSLAERCGDPKQGSFDWLAGMAEVFLGPQPERVEAQALPPLTAQGPPLEFLTLGPFTLAYNNRQLTLREQGVSPFWHLAVSWFGGTPTLSVAQKDGGVDISLVGAYYPGTTIPASLRAAIRLVEGEWTLRLRLKYASFDATLPLSPWLKRTDWAISPVHLDLDCCPLGLASALVAHGPGVAAFTPDWLLGTLSIGGFRLQGFPGSVSADAALVALLRPGSQQFFLPNSQRRTGIAFADNQQFPLQPEFGTSAPTIHLGDFRFDGLLLEAGLLPNAQAIRFLVAHSQTDPTLAGLETGGGLRGSDGTPLRIPLRNPLYAQLFDDERQRLAAGLVARVENEPFWLHSPGVSLLLAPSRQMPFTGILQVGEMPPGMVCRLSLLKSAPRVEGMLVRPEAAPPRSELLITWRPLPGSIQPAFGHVEVDAASDSATVRLPGNTTLAVVRRDDFLHLGYHWTNLRLVSEGATRRLVPLTAGPSHLAVIFPPQSIGEETFFETDDSYEVEDSDIPSEGDQPGESQLEKAQKLEAEAKGKKNDPGYPPPPPVKALLAKPSRLVFLLPQGAPGFLLDSSTLLDWQSLTPSLAVTALPGAVMLERPDFPDIVLPGAEPVLRLSDVKTSQVAPDSTNRVASISRFSTTLRRRGVLGNLRPIDRISVLPGLLLKPTPPPATTTQIEIPFRLLLSPNRYGTWVHAAEPVTRAGRSELWHTRLAVRSGHALSENPHAFRTVRAIWSRDHDITAAFDKPFLMPLDQDDRRQIVHLTSDFTIQDFTPPPVRINSLMLSSMGGWLDSDLQLQPPSGYAVEQWRHRATMGRDHYVRVVYKGFLFPFGHRASLVKISEGKVEPSPSGDPVAYIRQRMFLVLRERERTYGGGAYEHEGRETPLRRVRITTVVTPNLDPPQDSPLSPPEGSAWAPQAVSPIAAFWPSVGERDFSFHLKGWDWEGHELDFLMPLAFVRSDVLVEENEEGEILWIGEAAKAYNCAEESRRTTSLGGQQLALADADGYDGKTTFDALELSFKALPPADGSREPPCYPELEQAKIALAALRQMSGANDAATIVLASQYLDDGFHPDKNKAGLFAEIPSPPSLDYSAGNSADRCGGVATPSLMIRGLSRELGVVGETDDSFATGNLDPAQFFAGLDAKLLGGISLASILEELSPDNFLDQAPKLVTINSAEEITTTLDWRTTRLKSNGTPFRPHGDCVLRLQSVLRTPKAGEDKTFSLKGSLRNFSLNLAGVVRVNFNEFSFTSVHGKKPDVHVDISSIEFEGPLAFVNTLRDYLQPANFADPPFLEVTPQGIAAGYSLSIPAVSVGVVSIANIALGARLSLPITGEPMRLRFNLSERHNPFIVSVAPFGGGGFFALAVGMDGVETLEVSLEFGGCAAIDLGVASGGISLMAGIYIKIELASNHSQLTGYVRANGCLEVIGLIAISLEFYLGLNYEPNGPTAWGECRVTVTVEVLFFSADVTVPMRQQFAGSTGGDPPFGEMMPQPRWAAYAAAFS